MKHGLIKSAIPLSDAEVAQLKQKFRAIVQDEVDLKIEIVPELIGGFIAQVDGKLYDMSMKGKLSDMQLESREHILHEGSDASFVSDEQRKKFAASMDEAFHKKLVTMETSAKIYDYGTVQSCADGIVHIDKLHRSLYGELLEFENGAFGMALELSSTSVGAVLFSDADSVAAGSIVRGTGSVVSVPVGEELLGRVVDPLGRPLDGNALRASGTRPIESPAPSIMDRATVNQPLQTGILSIDSMIPIGKGQRELIIGDRQMGKSVIAISTMLNQSRRGVVCIYVAIGQKSSSVAQFVESLKKNGAMSNSIVVAATASSSAAMQYIAPYAGCAMGEYYMAQGRDVLIIYDDLSKHAAAYRTMSLLLKRPPGREAYPGDVFYLHSRLLERAAKLAPEKGGGSMTALPIVETMAGDISAYIPTNVISITDGQIYLESELFYAGIRPAVNVGLSVSRVGRAAQPEAMKKVSSNLRLKLAQYRELAVFAQFDSDLDPATQKTLASGERLTELLKQDQNTVFTLSEQVAILMAFNAGLFDKTPIKEILDKRARMLTALHRSVQGCMLDIDRTDALGGVDNDMLQAAIKRFFADEGDDHATHE